jgi:hypothetical protein
VIVDGLGLTYPQPGWVVLDAIRDRGLTGSVVLGGSPAVRVFADQGDIYWAEEVGSPSIGARLVDARVLSAVQLERGAVRHEGVERLERLFERVPAIERDTVLVAVRALAEESLVNIAAQMLAGVLVEPYIHHSSGIHLWNTQHPVARRNSVGRPPISAPPAQAPAATDPPVVADVAPPVVAPSVAPPPVVAPSVTEPPHVEPSVTAPPVTAPSVTAPSVTAPSVTAPSVTAPPVTAPPDVADREFDDAPGSQEATATSEVPNTPEVPQVQPVPQMPNLPAVPKMSDLLNAASTNVRAEPDDFSLVWRDDPSRPEEVVTGPGDRSASPSAPSSATTQAPLRPSRAAEPALGDAFEVRWPVSSQGADTADTADSSDTAAADSSDTADSSDPAGSSKVVEQSNVRLQLSSDQHFAAWTPSVGGDVANLERRDPNQSLTDALNDLIVGVDRDLAAVRHDLDEADDAVADLLSSDEFIAVRRAIASADTGLLDARRRLIDHRLRDRSSRGSSSGSGEGLHSPALSGDVGQFGVAEERDDLADGSPTLRRIMGNLRRA